jgi:hypothetical protein
MYPQRDLNRLGVHKAALLDRIIARRDAAAREAAIAVRPLLVLEKLFGLTRRFASLLGPLTLLLAPTVLKRTPRVGALLKWSSIAFTIARGIGAITGSRAAPVRHPSS